jgi:hypothetical protein
MPPRRKQSGEVHASPLREETENTQEEIMKREDYYDNLHRKHLPAFKELIGRMVKGVLKIIDIRIDAPQFGSTRVIIYFHDTEE